MKSSVIPSVRVAPEFRAQLEQVLHEDESLSAFVEAAVRDLHDQYGCRVFNFSYGDLNKIYDGRHVRGFAYTLDRLTRELGVLFVVPTGNLHPSELPDNSQDVYPNTSFLNHRAYLIPLRLSTY